MIIAAVLLYLSSIFLLLYESQHNLSFFLSRSDICIFFMIVNFILASIIVYDVIAKKYNIKFFTKLKKFILNEEWLSI